MEMSFKAQMMKRWTLLDDRIIYGKKEIPFSSITKVENDPPKWHEVSGIIKIYHVGTNTWESLGYSKRQVAEANEALNYILAHVSDSAKALEKFKSEGAKMRCNVCGNIFCYDMDDLKENKRLAKSAIWNAVGSLGGTYASSATQQQTANDQLNRIVDYSRCPKCGSRDLSEATDEDIARANAPQNISAQQVSAADELMKFKGLLDMGVITQEEFDAKKKQLLGL